MATLARYQGTAVDDAGNVLTTPSVEVRRESDNALVVPYSDRAGTATLANPFGGNVDGTFAFHVPGGAYKVTVIKGGVTRILRYVAIGTNAELDSIYDGAIAPVTPLTNDGAALGSPTKNWSDLFLASGAVINFNNGDVLITHAADLLTFSLGNYTFSGTVSIVGNLGVTSGAIAARIDPRLSSAASGDISPDISVGDYYVRTALAATCTINAPTGTPVGGDKLMFRFKDNGTAKTLTWNAIFRGVGVVVPTVTTASKTTYVAAIYNSTDTKWDVVAVNTEG